MPELPEVQTTVSDLEKKILGRVFVDVWTDCEKIIKKPKSFREFKKKIKGKKIEKIWRRGKNIIFNLSGKPPSFLLIHQKLTGHLLLGKWEIKKERGKIKIESKIEGPLKDPINLFLHLIFYLDNGFQLGLSDLRKFAKVTLLDKKELEKEIEELGPEPLDENFTFEKFKKVLPKKGKIKEVLMNQKIIAGIGNIYSDEILWRAKIHPLKEVFELKENQLREIFKAMKEILKEAIKRGGESISDYRRITGEKGNFDEIRKVYRREGEKCFRCQSKIKRLKIKGRSSYFCEKCQKL